MQSVQSHRRHDPGSLDRGVADHHLRLPGQRVTTSTVDVHITHTWIGDLVVTLIAPDGSSYLLHNRAGGNTDNIDQTYTPDLSSEQRNGTWKLRVQDAASADIGRIDAWTINL